jgi:hypothetical protein
MIKDYKFGSINVDGKKYTSDIIVFEDVVSSWWRVTGHEVAIKDIEGLVAKRPDAIVFGTGASGCMKVPNETIDYIKSKGVDVVVKRTSEAVTSFNDLSNRKKVACALHLTC